MHPRKILVVCLYVILCLDNCFSTIFHGNPTYFATKSKYHRSVGKPMTIPSGCRPIHLNMVIRHGTRFPSINDRRKILKMLDLVHKDMKARNLMKLHYQDLKLPWAYPFSESDTADKILTRVGEEEMYNLSKRLLDTFPDLLSQRYSTLNYTFLSTSTERTCQSASAFAYGLFEGSGNLGSARFQPVAITSRSKDADPVLRFFDICDRYVSAVLKNTTAQEERGKFRNGPEMQELGRRIEQRLGMKEGVLSPQDVTSMFLLCAYGTGVLANSDWCSVFSEKDLQVLEYLFDLKNYWKKGPAHKISYQISCPLLSDVVKTIKSALPKRNGPRRHVAVFRFAHAETLIPFVALLGMFHSQTPLRADNFGSHKDRLFRPSFLFPFGGNVGFVIYECESSNDVELRHQYKIQILINEGIVPIPFCNDQELCPLDDFFNFYNSTVQNCDFNAICQEKHENHLHQDL